MTVDDVLVALRNAISVAGTTKAWALQHGFAPSYIGDVLGRHRPPSDRVLEALGLEKVVTYRRLNA